MMKFHVAPPLSYIHERYLGRPSCPKCGELVMAPESSEYHNANDIRHIWACDGCEYQFKTLISFDLAAA